MSFDLYCWRLAGPQDVRPSELLDILAADEGHASVAPMSRHEVVAAFSRHYADLNDTGIEIEWEGDGSYFQASFSYDQARQITSLQIFCGFNLLTQPGFKRLYDVAYNLRCRVYDPQGGNVHVPSSEAGTVRRLTALITRQKWRVEPA